MLATSKNKWFERIERIIAEQPAGSNLSNCQLANRMAMSERHFIRQVKEVTGTSPQRYIRKRRMQVAMYSLKKGSYKTVKAAAEAIGYRNASHFIQQFEKEFGQKPFHVLREAGWR